MFRKVRKILKIPNGLKEHSLISTCEEIICSMVPVLFHRYCKEHENLIAEQCQYIRKNLDLTNLKKITSVGCGAIPFVSIYLSKYFKKEFCLIEKNYIAQICAKRICRKYGFSQFEVIYGKGQDFKFFEDSLVMISIHTKGKRKILDRVLSCNNNLVVLKQPIEKYSFIGDILKYNEIEEQTSGLKLTKIQRKFSSSDMYVIDNT